MVKKESSYMEKGASKNVFEDVRKKYTYSNMIDIINQVKNLKVLVIGDVIIDEYAYSETLERAKKEPVLVFRYLNSNFFAGGILAIANHVAEFCDNITLVTCVGKDNLTRNLLNKKLNKKVERKLFYNNEPTLVKRRYIEKYWNRKLFEIYNKESNSRNIPEQQILEYLEKNTGLFDVVIVGDFGHGVIRERIKDVLIKKSNYLSVNVQTNSGNLGFNLITKVPKADFVSMTHEELQLAMSSKDKNMPSLVSKLSKKINCNKICVTLGKEGILYYENGFFYYCPVFSKEVVDTVGAGDAVFSLVSLVSKINKDPRIIPFLGNCVGALAVKIVGNSKPIAFGELSNFLIDVYK